MAAVPAFEEISIMPFELKHLEFSLTIFFLLYSTGNPVAITMIDFTCKI